MGYFQYDIENKENYRPYTLLQRSVNNRELHPDYIRLD